MQFSAKLFKTFYTSVRPLIEDKYAAKLQVVFRPQIQPWHPSSTLVTEAAVAVLRLAPAQFWPFSQALFEQQTQFFDASVVNETRNQTYARLAKIAAGFGVEENAFLDLVRVADKPGPDGSLNGGNQVTNDVKVLVKVCPIPCLLLLMSYNRGGAGRRCSRWFEFCRYRRIGLLVSTLHRPCF